MDSLDYCYFLLKDDLQCAQPGNPGPQDGISSCLDFPAKHKALRDVCEIANGTLIHRRGHVTACCKYVSEFKLDFFFEDLEEFNNKCEGFFSFRFFDSHVLIGV